MRPGSERVLLDRAAPAASAPAPSPTPMTFTEDQSPSRVRTPSEPDRSGEPARDPSAGREERPRSLSVSSRRAVLDREPVALSQAVRWMNRRRTRAAALLALVLAAAILAGVVLRATGPRGPSEVERATEQAWAAAGALSDGLRKLEPGDRLKPLRPKARAARAAVQEAGKATKALDLGGAQASVQRRTVRALRADDAWIAAVSSTLANRRSRRRGDLSRLAGNAMQRTAAIAEDVPAARGTVGGTGRLLTATKRR